VLEDWRYIAMVINRLQLYIFLTVTVVGSVSILINASPSSSSSSCVFVLINAPHIYTYVDQDSVIAGLQDSTNGTLPK